MREIIFYATTSGQNPIQDFLETLTSKKAQKVTWVLNLVGELDRVPSQYFKKLINTNDIWVRALLGSNIFRLLGFFGGINLFVLAHAFKKKTQKTPKRDIRIAEERKQDYLRRS